MYVCLFIFLIMSLFRVFCHHPFLASEKIPPFWKFLSKRWFDLMSHSRFFFFSGVLFDWSFAHFSQSMKNSINLLDMCKQKCFHQGKKHLKRRFHSQILSLQIPSCLEEVQKLPDTRSLHWWCLWLALGC